MFYCKLEDAKEGNLRMFFAGTTPGVCRCLFNIVPCALERWSSAQLWLLPKLFYWSVKVLVLLRAHTCMGCQPSGSCCFYRTDEELSSSECKRRKFAEALASVFFYHEKHSHVEMSYSLTTSQIYRYDFRFFFNWWHSPLAWWHSQELKFRKNHLEINNQFSFL